MLDHNDPMLCKNCGADMHDVGIQQLHTVYATSDAAWNGESWQWTGDTEYFEMQHHIEYQCGNCAHELSQAQEESIGLIA